MANFHIVEEKFKEIFSRFEENLKAIRTGRAHASMLDAVFVESYGAKVPLEHVATVSTPDARTIIVKPWDKSTIPAIEQGIQRSNIGIQPISEKDQIRLSIPTLTEERRKEMTKMVGKKMEEARIAVRKERDDLWKQIQTEERDKTISENQKFQEKEKMERMVEDINKKIADVSAKKEKELMEI